MKKRDDIVFVVLLTPIALVMECLFFINPSTRKATLVRWKKSWVYTRENGGWLLINMPMRAWNVEDDLHNSPMAGYTVNDESGQYV